MRPNTNSPRKFVPPHTFHSCNRIHFGNRLLDSPGVSFAYSAEFAFRLTIHKLLLHKPASDDRCVFALQRRLPDNES